MRLTCNKYPSLLITHPHIEFVDGVADVTEEVADVIAPLAAVFGIAIPKVETTPDTGPKGDSEEGDGDPVEDAPKPAPKRGPGRPPKNRG